MDSRSKAIHRILQILLLGGFVWEFVFYLMHWGSLPEEPGIHFAPDGTFDVHASKIYGFYPHLISLVVIVTDLVMTRVVSKEKLELGLRVTEKGKKLILSSIVITLDIVAIGIVLCFCCWVYAVSKQNEVIMDRIPSIILTTALTVAFAGVVFQCIVNTVCKEKTEAEKNLSPEEKRKRKLRFLLTGSADGIDPTKHHSLFRILSWIFVGMIMVISLFCLERLPQGDVADNYHGLAYFANFGDYYAKWLVFMPFILCVPIMLLCEFVSVRANKKGRAALVVLCDRIKLALAVFGSFWELLLLSELPIGAVSVILFALACTRAFVSYSLERRRADKKA